MENQRKKCWRLLRRDCNINPEDEIQVAMNEQHKITVIRLVKLIEELSEKADLRSHLTTHALDTSLEFLQTIC